MIKDRAILSYRIFGLFLLILGFILSLTIPEDMHCSNIRIGGCLISLSLGVFFVGIATGIVKGEEHQHEQK